jgi:hypothetical protein
LATASAARGGGRRVGGGHQAPFAEIGRVREAGRLAGDDADARTAVPAAGHLFDPPVVEAGGRRPLVLGVDLGEVGTGPDRTGQHPFEHVLIDHAVEPRGDPTSRRG